MDETIYICKECTSNKHLKVYIQEHSNSIEIEKCLYCGGEKQKAIAIVHLAEHVRICIEKLYHKKKEKEYEFLYPTQNESDKEALEEDISTGLKEDSGTADKSLDTILREEVFSQSFVSQVNQKILLEFVAHMGFANPYEYLERNDCFNRTESNKQTLWSEFVNISKYSNRYFTPKNGRREDILNQLSAMFVSCKTEIKQGQSFFRVRSVKVSEIKGLKDLTRTQRERKLWEDQFYSNNTFKENLSMPAPIEVTKDNRMSPRGISYCYLASNEKLGLAENRVCNHDDVLIATFKKKNL